MSGRCAGAGGCGTRARSIRGRQHHPEHRAAAGRAGDGDVAAGQARELTGDREAEAQRRAAVLARCWPGSNRWRRSSGAHARAVVAHLDHGAAVGGPRRTSTGWRSRPIGQRVRGVEQQVEDDLRDARRRDRGRPARRRDPSTRGVTAPRRARAICSARSTAGLTSAAPMMGVTSSGRRNSWKSRTSAVIDRALTTASSTSVSQLVDLGSVGAARLRRRSTRSCVQSSAAIKRRERVGDLVREAGGEQAGGGEPVQARERLRGNRRDVMLERRVVLASACSSCCETRAVSPMSFSSSMRHSTTVERSSKPRTDRNTAETAAFASTRFCHEPPWHGHDPTKLRGSPGETRTRTTPPDERASRELRADELGVALRRRDRSSLRSVRCVLRAHHAPALEARAQRVRVQAEPARRASLAFDHPARLGQHLLDVPALDLGDRPRRRGVRRGRAIAAIGMRRRRRATGRAGRRRPARCGARTRPPARSRSAARARCPATCRRAGATSPRARRRRCACPPGARSAAGTSAPAAGCPRRARAAAAARPGTTFSR